MKKPLYDETFKKKTVQYVKESGKAVAVVARELKIKDNTLYGWVKKYGDEPEIAQHQVFKSEDHQLREMQKQIRELQEENEIYALLRERPSVKYEFIQEYRFDTGWRSCAK
jgi:transposase-like protein